MRVALAGEGAFGRQHLDTLAAIEGTEVVCLVGGERERTQALAAARGVTRWTLDLGEALALPEVDAVILATPTPLHAAQAIRCLEAGKPVLVEIPMADNLADARRLVETARRVGLTAMAGHTRRFNPSHRWIRRRIAAGELRLLQLDVQTHFLRRTNLNALGEARSWTDHLLWHHACHTVDLFHFQTGEIPDVARGVQGPPHPQLRIAMDMAIQLRTPRGAICTLGLSFNNDGPLGSVFRYICDNGTYIARYDALADGHGQAVDLSDVSPANGLQAQDEAFLLAVAERRESEAAVGRVLPAYETLARIEQTLIEPPRSRS